MPETGHKAPEPSKETQDKSLLETLKSKELEKSRSRLQILRENLKSKETDRETLKDDHSLGGHEENEEIAQIIASDDIIIQSATGSVDRVRHKERPEDLNEYIATSAKIESFSKFFTEQTKSLYETHKPLIEEIQAVKTDEDWSVILEKHGRLVTDPQGPLNFILAFMRATENGVLEKIDKNQVAENFQIELKVSRRRSTEIQIIYPEYIKDLNETINNNLSLFIEIRRERFWQKSSPSALAEIFLGEYSVFGSIFEKLTRLKKENPSLFEKHNRYPQILGIVSDNLIKFYRSYGAIDKNSENLIAKYKEHALSPVPTASEDTTEIWRNKSTIEWLSDKDFWSVAMLNPPIGEELFRGKSEKEKSGILIDLYDKLVKPDNSVNPENFETFFLLANRIIEYFKDVKPSPPDLAEIKEQLAKIADNTSTPENYKEELKALSSSQ